MRIQKGSWQALIPSDIAGWLRVGVGSAFTTYVITAAGRMAKHDFREVGLRDVFVEAFRGIQFTIRLGKHIGTLSKKHLMG